MIKDMDIPQKESLTVEFKSDLQRPDVSEKKRKFGYPDSDLIDEIVGMANTEGGSLYLGVEDDGAITGLAPAHEDTIGLTAMVSNRTVPSLTIRAEIISIQGKQILIIDIPKSYSIIATVNGKILRRRIKADGSPENVPLYPFEIPHRLSNLSQLDVSAQPISEGQLEDLSHEQMNRIRSIIRERNGDQALLGLTDEELQKALHMVIERDGILYPTLTGLLLAGREESIRRLVPTMCSVFQVLQGTDIVMNEEFVKPIPETLQLYDEYMKAWNPEQEMEYGLFRIPIPAFSRPAFREGLINAFAHRDYTMLGRVRIMIDQEGMTISNPGGFIDGVTLDNLLTVEPHGRNPCLSDALKRMGLAEKTGRGVDRIFEGSITFGRPWPDYSQSTSEIVVLFIARGKADLPFMKIIMDEQQRTGKELGINPLLILSALKSYRKLSKSELIKITHIPSVRIGIILENMVESGLIEETGKNIFILSKNLYTGTGKAKEYVRQAGIDKIRYPEMILKLAKTQGSITKGDIVQLLHVTPSEAYRQLRELRSQGKIELLHSGRYATYKLT